jgi:hypothetical protein
MKRRHPSDAHRFVGTETTRCVGQNGIAFGVDVIEQVSSLFVEEPLAPHRHGNALRPRQVKCLLHDIVGIVLARADEKATGECVRTDC